MPIYEYQCQTCGHTMEAFQSMSEASLTDCPECKGKSLQRLISAAGFQLKGTGWYATDFKNSGKPKPQTPPASTESSAGSTKGDTTSSTSSDTKTGKTGTES